MQQQQQRQQQQTHEQHQQQQDQLRIDWHHSRTTPTLWKRKPRKQIKNKPSQLGFII